jgi:hypothetical protein
MSAPKPIANGTHIGPYEITGWLGAGGMGEVYRARDPRLGRDVAIYFVHGIEPTAEMDNWRVRPNGESREQLTERSTALNYLAVLDAQTVLYVARDRDRSGPWLWTLDVPSKVSRRVVTGLDPCVLGGSVRDRRQ